MLPGQAPKLQSKISFDKHDTNGNGMLDAAELKALCRSLGRHFSDAEIAMAVRKLDKSGDGQIQYDEFKSWWAGGESRWQQLELSEAEMAAATQAIAYFDHCIKALDLELWTRSLRSLVLRSRT